MRVLLLNLSSSSAEEVSRALQGEGHVLVKACNLGVDEIMSFRAQVLCRSDAVRPQLLPPDQPDEVRLRPTDSDDRADCLWWCAGTFSWIGVGRR